MKAVIAGLLLFASTISIGQQRPVCDTNIRHDCLKGIQFYRQLQQAVESNDRKRVAEMIAYPIGAITLERPLRIETKREFLQHYDEILTPEVRCVLRSTPAGTVETGAEFSDGVFVWRAISANDSDLSWEQRISGKYPVKIVEIVAANIKPGTCRVCSCADCPDCN